MVKALQYAGPALASAIFIAHGDFFTLAWVRPLSSRNWPVAESLSFRSSPHLTFNGYSSILPIQSVGTRFKTERSIGRKIHTVTKIGSDFVTGTLSVATVVDTMNQSDAILETLASPPILITVAFLLGVVANGWIQRLLSGERGLGSYLSDGKGYNKSKFQPLQGDSDRAVQFDPLPWLKLPQLDFVEVAGQEPRQSSESEWNDFNGVESASGDTGGDSSGGD